LLKLNELLHFASFPAGATIMVAEQPGEVAYILLTGTLKVLITQVDGTDVILAILGPGEVVGELSLVDHLGRSANVIALEPVTLLWLDRNTFQECRRAFPSLTDNMFTVLARRLRLANAQIQALATLDVYGRVAHQLLAFADAYGEPVPEGGIRIALRLTQSDLAGMVGATRVRVNQVLGAFKRNEYISVDAAHHITVYDADALELHCR
jgi:CRP/FNR family cyclic AMP-dependent transcriptional regulator